MPLRWLLLLPAAAIVAAAIIIGSQAGALLLALLAVGAWYVAVCAWWPLTNCRRCKGSGKFRSPSGKAWRLCRTCKGTGTRIRPGRIVWDRLVTAHRASKKR